MKKLTKLFILLTLAMVMTVSFAACDLGDSDNVQQYALGETATINDYEYTVQGAYEYASLPTADRIDKTHSEAGKKWIAVSVNVKNTKSFTSSAPVSDIKLFIGEASYAVDTDSYTYYISGHSTFAGKEIVCYLHKSVSLDAGEHKTAIIFFKVPTDVSLTDSYLSIKYLSKEAKMLTGSATLQDTTEMPAMLTVIEINEGTAYEISACDTTATGAISIPASHNGKPVTSIGNDAFKDCVELTEIELPDSITRIGDNAFRGCSKIGLSNISIPASVASVGKDAFLNTALWTNHANDSAIFVSNWIVGIKGSLEEFLVSQNGVLSLSSTTIGVADSTFIAQTDILTFGTGNNIKYIGKNAFRACLLMETAVIGNNVKTIDSLAFYGCFALTNVAITSKTTVIAKDAFSGNSYLAHIHYAGTEAEWAANNSEVELPAGVTFHYNYVG